MSLAGNPFASEAPVLGVDEAFALVVSRLRPVTGVETVPLAQADGRILAEPLLAQADLPAFDHAAVDGVAFRAGDGGNGGRFRLVTRIAAGQAPGPALAAGEAARIFTGAALPAGADAVAMQEETRFGADGTVLLPAGLAPGANVRHAGEERRAGAQLLAAGRRLGPAEIGLAAALGVAAVRVRRRLRVALFSTGDEIGAAGAVGRADANGPMLAALLARLGCAVTPGGVVPDRPEAIAGLIGAAAGAHDLILSSGGVSVGEADHVRAGLAKLGPVGLWTLAMKPGRRMATGLVAGTPFIGLAGNPVAAFAGFVQVARPAIVTLAGGRAQPLRPLPARARFACTKPAGRRDFLRGSTIGEAGGVLEVVAGAQDGSGFLTTLTENEGMIVVAEAVTRLEPGMPVGFLPMSALLDAGR